MTKSNNQTKTKTKQILFGGCAGMYPYQIGVASVIQKYYRQENQSATPKPKIVFAGISGGCLPALFLALNLDIDDLYHGPHFQLLHKVNQAPLGALFNFLQHLPETLNQIIPPDAYQQLNQSQTLRISVTNLSTQQNQIIDQFQDNQDLIQAIQASCHLPILTNTLTHQWQDQHYLDGILSDPQGKLLQDQKKYQTYEVQVYNWRTPQPHWFWPTTNPDQIEQLYALGIQDQHHHLDQLLEFLKTSHS